MKINDNFNNLNNSYLFSTIARKVTEYQKHNPEKRIIKLGIGDVTLPLCESVINAMRNSLNEMSEAETFRGYAPEQGYEFLRSAVQKYYTKYNVQLELNEIFISDGAKSDLANILDLFDADNTVLIPDPVYPVYVDTNIMNGRKIIYMDANRDNGFLPLPDYTVRADIIYLCSPNNPTGAVYNRKQLKMWVDYALECDAVILFDAAYESFISSEDFPRSIYEIEGAYKCAIEFCSLSKTAGFTGVRCGYTIVPNCTHLNNMWLRRQTTKFNGVSYMVQRGAQSVFSESGQREIQLMIEYYKNNAKIISSALDSMGIYYTGGVNSPYIWMRCPYEMDSWKFFDYMLDHANVVGTPGDGFGKNGKNHFRLTAFGNSEDTIEAINRIKSSI
jgi:LL-diaminopimelate aminotransferase